MVPDDVAHTLAIIYGEQPPQDASQQEGNGLDPVQVTTTGTLAVDAAPLSAPEKADAITMATGGVAPNGEYQVKPGETLNSISLALYGDLAHAAQILTLNQQAGRLINDNLMVNGLLLLP